MAVSPLYIIYVPLLIARLFRLLMLLLLLFIWNVRCPPPQCICGWHSWRKHIHTHRATLQSVCKPESLIIIIIYRMWDSDSGRERENEGGRATNGDAPKNLSSININNHNNNKNNNNDDGNNNYNYYYYQYKLNA